MVAERLLFLIWVFDGIWAGDNYYARAMVKASSIFPYRGYPLMNRGEEYTVPVIRNPYE